MSSMEKETPFMISCCLMIWVSYSMMRILFFIFYFYSLAVFPSLLSGVWFPCSELNLLIALVILYTIHDSTLFLLEVGKERCTKWSCIPDLYIEYNYIFFVASHFLNNSNCWFFFFSIAIDLTVSKVLSETTWRMRHSFAYIGESQKEQHAICTG